LYKNQKYIKLPKKQTEVKVKPLEQQLEKLIIKIKYFKKTSNEEIRKANKEKNSTSYSYHNGFTDALTLVLADLNKLKY